MKFTFEPWMYWTLGIFVYFVGAVICSAICGDDDYDTNVEMGLKGIVWPLFFFSLILSAPFWIIGKCASYIQEKWL